MGFHLLPGPAAWRGESGCSVPSHLDGLEDSALMLIRGGWTCLLNSHHLPFTVLPGRHLSKWLLRLTCGYPCAILAWWVVLRASLVPSLYLVNETPGVGAEPHLLLYFSRKLLYSFILSFSHIPPLPPTVQDFSASKSARERALEAIKGVMSWDGWWRPVSLLDGCLLVPPHVVSLEEGSPSLLTRTPGSEHSAAS